MSSRSLRKFVFAGMVLLLLAVAWRLTPLRQYLSDVQKLKADLAGTGVWAPLIFILASGVLIAVGMSRLLFCGLAGAIFGFAKGLLYSEIATVAGAYLCFLYARWLGKDVVKNRSGRYAKVAALIEGNAFVGIILVRQLPIGGIVLNLALGLTSISDVTFLVGSAIGFLPEGIVATLIGSSSAKSSLSHSIGQIALAILVVLICGYGVWKIRQKSALNQALAVEITNANLEKRDFQQ